MDEAALWTLCTIAGLTVLGASAGSLVILQGEFTTPQFVALLFASTFLASAFAVQLHRRGRDHAMLVGGLASALGVFGFFSTPILSMLNQGVDVDATGAFMLLVVAPLVAGGMAAFGTRFLARGVDRHRESHGSVHAPK